jgi:hypothetical protein
MAFFTNGQKTIVRNAVSTSRLSLLSSSGCAALSLDEVQAIDAIAIYPNPVSQYFNVTSLQISIDEVELFNINGQLVKSQKLNQLNNVVDVSDLATGTYFARIYTEGKFLKSEKIIKN